MSNCCHYCGAAPKTEYHDGHIFWECGSDKGRAGKNQNFIQSDKCRIQELERECGRLEVEVSKANRDYEWWDKLITRIVEAVYNGNVIQDEWTVDELVKDVQSAYENKLRLEALNKEPGDGN